MIDILEIITGHTGVDHVTSADDASLYRSIFGAEDVVLNVGSQFEHTIISSNLIKIADGDLVIQGHQARIRTNDYEELVIDNGTPGMFRNDLIVARYEKDVVSGIESVELAVVKGTPALTAVDPELTQDDITSGGTLREFPLYRVKLNGINIQAVEKMFKLSGIERGNNANGEWVRNATTGFTVVFAQKTITVSSAAAGQQVLITQDFPLQFDSTLPLFMTESGVLYAEDSTSSFMTTIKRGGQSFASGYGRENRWNIYMSHENSGSLANRARFFGVAAGYTN